MIDQLYQALFGIPSNIYNLITAFILGFAGGIVFVIVSSYEWAWRMLNFVLLVICTLFCVGLMAYIWSLIL